MDVLVSSVHSFVYSHISALNKRSEGELDVLVKTSVAKPEPIVFKLRMRLHGVNMTDSELEAMQALLMTECASSVQDGLQKGQNQVPAKCRSIEAVER